jgi:hypothetical protein
MSLNGNRHPECDIVAGPILPIQNYEDDLDLILKENTGFVL